MVISNNYNKMDIQEITHKNMDIKKLQQEMDISENYNNKWIFKKIATITNGYLKK